MERCALKSVAVPFRNMAEDTAQQPTKTSAALPIKHKTNRKHATAVKGKKRKRISKSLSFPAHSLTECLRIPRAVLEQNAGRECKDPDAAKFAGLKYDGNAAREISSALKYGLLERPRAKIVLPTELTRRIVRPQKTNDDVEAMREAILKAPVISDVYKHYRGEFLPDRSFLVNTVTDSFHLPADKADEFVKVFLATLADAKLLEETGDKTRVLDVTHAADVGAAVAAADEHLKKVSKGVAIEVTDTCFVMMPFQTPLGGYFDTVYEPAIKKAGLKALRADNEVFGTGKIIDQIWSGINSARVLLAELTSRNANVFYELGLAHALGKPVVLVSRTQDVPFDVSHVRVIYYDLNDPFWGSKLIDKVAENLVSAMKNPKEAILFPSAAGSERKS
jgi:hypothetical protein